MPILPQEFFQIFTENNIDFFTGVPDSLLKQFCLCIDDNVSQNDHIITANEGNAIALATGYYLGTGKIAAVYMQNSGLGNAINPLLSLADKEVYSIPMVLIIGWRGEPGVKDEPQHIKQGKVQLDLLDSIGLPYEIIEGTDIAWQNKVENIINKAEKENRPAAVIVKKGAIAKYKTGYSSAKSELMTREDALKIIINKLPKDTVIVSTTGKTSREIFEIRVQNNEPHFKDFLTVGSMGHCSSIALGIALTQPNRKIICIDGDGALLMHLGSVATIGKVQPKNFYHILMNNFVHESVGGQSTAIDAINIIDTVKSANYQEAISVASKEELINNFNDYLFNAGPSFLEIKLQPGSRTNLGRPTIKPVDNKYDLIQFLNKK